MPSASGTEATDFYQKLAGDLVDIYIAESEEPLKLPKTLLCSKGRWFRNALEGNFEEGSINIIRLPDVSNDSFKIFVFWLYRDRIPAHNKSMSKDEVVLVLEGLCTAWIMGDKYCLREFQNDITHRLCDYAASNATDFSVDLTLSIYRQTMPGSKLRKLSAEVMIVRLDRCKQNIDDYAALHTFEGFAADLYHAAKWYWQPTRGGHRGPYSLLSLEIFWSDAYKARFRV